MKKRKNNLSHLKDYQYEFHVLEEKSLDELIDEMIAEANESPPKTREFTEKELQNAVAKIVVAFLSKRRDEGEWLIDINELIEEFKGFQDE